MNYIRVFKNHIVNTLVTYLLLLLSFNLSSKSTKHGEKKHCRHWSQQYVIIHK